jgi:hypothetical protein
MATERLNVPELTINSPADDEDGASKSPTGSHAFRCVTVSETGRDHVPILCGLNLSLLTCHPRVQRHLASLLDVCAPHRIPLAVVVGRPSVMFVALHGQGLALLLVESLLIDLRTQVKHKTPTRKVVSHSVSPPDPSDCWLCF